MRINYRPLAPYLNLEIQQTRKMESHLAVKPDLNGCEMIYNHHLSHLL